MKACVTWNSRIVTIQSICDILMKIVMLQMVSICKEMVVNHLKLACQNSPEEAEEDENCVRITDNAVEIRSQHIPTEIQAPYCPR